MSRNTNTKLVIDAFVIIYDEPTDNAFAGDKAFSQLKEAKSYVELRTGLRNITWLGETLFKYTGGTGQIQMITITIPIGD